MYKTFNKICLLTLLLAGVASCKKKDPEPENPQPQGGSGVYAVFSDGNQWSKRSGKVWKDGVFQDLTDSSTMVYVNSIFVTNGGDVYAAGCECDQYGTPPNDIYMLAGCKVVYWKNGVKQVLSEAGFNFTEDAHISVADNGDVYVASAHPQDGAQHRVITLWKNGEKLNALTDGSYEAEVKDLLISGNDVYVAGYEESVGFIGVASVWKNGVKQSFSDGQQTARAMGIALAGSDMYVAVFEANASKLMKNGTAVTLTPALERIEDVCASGNDIYVLGTSSGLGYVVWKNGQKIHELKSFQTTYQSLYGQSISVLGDDVYVSGIVRVSGQTEVGVIWKNGEVINKLTDAIFQDVVDVPSIFVKQ